MKLALASLILALGVGRPATLLEPLGVCSIDEANVGCWDSQGAPKPDLEAEIRQRLSQDRYLGFIPGGKNRYLILRQPSGTIVRDVQSTGRENASFWPKKDGDTYVVVRMLSLSGAKAASVSLRLGIATGSPVEMRLRQDESAVVDGMKITLGAPISAPFVPWSGYVLPWRFGIDRSETTPPSRLQFVALDRQGQPINYVDDYGRPVDNAKGDAMMKKMQEGTWDFSKPSLIYGAFFQDGGLAPTQEGPWIYMNVDPKSIGKLQVRRVAFSRESYGPFPLDPASKTP